MTTMTSTTIRPIGCLVFDVRVDPARKENVLIIVASTDERLAEASRCSVHDVGGGGSESSAWNDVEQRPCHTGQQQRHGEDGQWRPDTTVHRRPTRPHAPSSSCARCRYIKVKKTASSLDIAPLTILDSGALQPRNWQLTGNDCSTAAQAVAAQSPR